MTTSVLVQPVPAPDDATDDVQGSAVVLGQGALGHPTLTVGVQHLASLLGSERRRATAGLMSAGGARFSDHVRKFSTMIMNMYDALSACTRPTHWYPQGRTGTNAGYQAHTRLGEAPCDPCRQASLARGRTDPSYLTARHKSQRTNRSIIHEAKSQPCADCGHAFPFYVMQFDHRPGTDKKFNVGQCGPTRGQHALRAEIEKCDVVCANCHAIRTHERGHYYERRKA